MANDAENSFSVFVQQTPKYFAGSTNLASVFPKLQYIAFLKYLLQQQLKEIRHFIDLIKQIINWNAYIICTGHDYYINQILKSHDPRVVFIFSNSVLSMNFTFQ